VLELTIGRVSGEHARSFPGACAFVDGQVRLTWAEVDRRANRLANALAGTGFGRGSRLMWLGQGSFRLIETVLAVAKLGGMVCPANWRQSEAELAFVLSDFDPSVAVGQRSEVGATVDAARAAHGGDVRWLTHDDEDGDESYEAFLASGSERDPGADVSADDPLLVLYTGAFGGTPNGSMLTHRNLAQQSLSIAWAGDLGPDTVYLNSGPMFHVANFMWSVPTMLHGGRNVFVPRVEADELCRVVERERCTRGLFMAPTVAQMVEHCRSSACDLSSLLVPDPDAWEGRAGRDTSRWGRAPGGYGQTEVTGYVTFNAYGAPGTGNSGRPAPFSAVRVAGEDGASLAPGETGEILAAGPLVHLGYWNRPEVNAARFSEGWWHTGDLGRIEADGSLHFVGPKARMIKTGGENVYPAEVEAALRAHPQVADAAVIGRPSAAWGQTVVAVLVPRGEAPGLDDIVRHCRERIASYKKPQELVVVAEIPRRGGAPDYDALDAAHGGGGYPGGANVGA
jgi:long-chain acyl-CoA synthetase